MNKPIAVLYINPTAKSTELLDSFLAKYIDKINQHLYIKKIKVSSKNIDEVKSRGIIQTPTLVYNQRQIISVEKIIKFLTPPSDSKEQFRSGVSNPDDLIHQYQDTLMQQEDVDDDPGDAINRDAEIRQKMAALQKRRPEMDGVDRKAKLDGGRKVKATQPVKSKFDNDDDFRSAARVDNITETPMKKYMDDEDGAMILEEYYLSEANASGKKQSTKPRRKPHT
jgi:hypothetical protein